MPAISALSGNLGLQASSNTIRGLGTGMEIGISWLFEAAHGSVLGHIGKSNYLSNMRRELRSGLVTASLLSSVLAAVAVIWSFTDKDNASILSTWAACSENSKPVVSQGPRTSICVWRSDISWHLDLNDGLNSKWGRNAHCGRISFWNCKSNVLNINVIQCPGEYVKIGPSQDCWSPWDCFSGYCWSVLSPRGQLCNI